MTFSIHLATALAGVLAVASLSPARDAASPTPPAAAMIASMPSINGVAHEKTA